MNSNHYQQYSTLEVDDSRLPETYKTGSSNRVDLPEATYLEGDLPESYHPSKEPPGWLAWKQSTICGLRRRTFWIVLAVVLVIVTAAAVGGGVGGSQAAKNSQSTSTPTASSGSSSTSTSPSSATSSSTKTGLLASSKLATVNYKDAAGIDHHRVYFQALNKALYQSAWNSTGQVWWVSPLTTKDKLSSGSADLDVKEQTPIAANIYYHSASAIDHHIYFLDSQNRVQELFSPSADGPWQTGSMGNNYAAAASSQLVTYAKACSNCLNANFVIYEDNNNALQIVSLTSNGWTQSQMNSDVPTPVAGSALAIAPIQVQGVAQISLYLNAVNMQEIHFDGSKWTWWAKLSKVLSASASITAFSHGWDATVNSTTDIEAFSTNPNSNDGISLQTWTASSWSGVNNPSTFVGIANYSTIASNQAGRIYGILDEANGPTIFEWAFDWTNGYSKVGSVLTSM